MQGAMQGPMQGAMQGPMQGAMQGPMQGAMQGPIADVSYTRGNKKRKSNDCVYPKRYMRIPHDNNNSLERVHNKIKYLKRSIKEFYKENKNIINILSKLDSIDSKITNKRVYKNDLSKYTNYYIEKKKVLEKLYYKKNIQIQKYFIIYVFIKYIYNEYKKELNSYSKKNKLYAEGCIYKHLLKEHSIHKKFIEAYKILIKQLCVDNTQFTDKLASIIEKLLLVKDKEDKEWNFMEADIANKNKNVLKNIYEIIFSEKLQKKPKKNTELEFAAQRSSNNFPGDNRFPPHRNYQSAHNPHQNFGDNRRPQWKDPFAPNENWNRQWYRSPHDID
jgi:hypothetical protein